MGKSILSNPCRKSGGVVKPKMNLKHSDLTDLEIKPLTEMRKNSYSTSPANTYS